MLKQIVRRLIALPAVLFAVGTFTFLALRIVPGDIVTLMASRALSAEQMETMRAEWGLDQPIWSQYLTFANGILHGNLGHSFTQGKSVLELLAERLPPTIELALCALVFSIVLGVSSGILSAMYQDRLPDYVSRLFAILGFSIPWFWLGLMLIALFSVRLGWTPVTGQLGSDVSVERTTNFLIIDTMLAGNWRALGDYLQHLILPTICVGLSVAGFIARITRSSMLEVMRSDHIRTARGKGVPERIVIGVHVMRNSMLPIITYIGLMFGSLLSGAVVTETVFAWPGVGKFLVDAIFKRDYPVVQGTVIFLAAFYVLVNLVVDLTYVWIDPRLRKAQGGGTNP
jgi:peptide/nickel transport system permease protein